MKVNVTAMSVVAALALLLGAGTWYINAVYLPRAQMEKAESLKTEADPHETQPSGYDYTVPVDEQAIAAEREKLELQQAADAAREASTEPEAETAPTTPEAQEDAPQPSDVWITRDYEHGGETHVSAEQPPAAPPKPAASTPPDAKLAAQTNPTPVKPKPAPTPEPEPDPLPEPEPVAPNDAESPIVALELGEERMPQAGEVRVIDGRTLVWYDGWGWIPEEAAVAMQSGVDSSAVNTGNAAGNWK